MRKINQYFNDLSELRKRSIHLLYLVFLILIFAFIPSNTPSMSNVTEQSYRELSSNTQSISTSNTILFLHLIQQRPELYQEIKFRALEIERLSENTIEYVDQLIQLLETRVDKENFFNAKRLLLSELQADSLYSALSLYRNGIAELTNYENTSLLNEVLPLNKYYKNANGDFVSMHKYYFSNNIKTSISHLEVLAAQIEQLYATGLQLLSAEIARKYADMSELNVMKLSQNERLTDIYDHHSLRSFFDHIESNGKYRSKVVVEDVENSFSIKAMHQNKLRAGDRVHYKLQFNKAQTEKIDISVRRVNDQFYYTMPTEGDFYFFPQTEGSYIFSFSDGVKTYRDQLYVAADQAKLRGGNMVLYAQASNKFNFAQDFADMSSDLSYSLDNGKIIQNGVQLELIPDHIGNARLELFAQMPYGKINIGNYTYTVIEKPLPQLLINGKPTGTPISVSDLKNSFELSLSGSTNTNINSFNATIIRTGSGMSSQIFYNRGNTASSAFIGELLKSKSADKVLLDGISAKTESGSTVTIAPYVLIIK